MDVIYNVGCYGVSAGSLTPAPNDPAKLRGNKLKLKLIRPGRLRLSLGVLAGPFVLTDDTLADNNKVAETAGPPQSALA